MIHDLQSVNTETIWYTDAYTIRTNPSDVGGGYVIMRGEDVVEEMVIHKRGMTNNEMELIGVAIAIAKAGKGDIIRTDSKNTIAWIRKGNPKARLDLRPLALLCYKLANEKDLTIEWIPREHNLAGILIENGKYADMVKTLGL